MAKSRPRPTQPLQPTPEQLEQLRTIARIERNRGIVAIINRAIPWVGLFGICYMAVLGVRALAGQLTIADIGIKVLGNIRISEAVAWLFGSGGVGYGLRQRALRHSVNETLGARVSELEQQLDRKRSSSALTRRGQTDPRDKP